MIRAVNAQHRPYGYAKNELAYRLRRALEELGSDLFVWTEASVEAAIDSVPEPDIMLAPPDKRPGVVPATAAALVVEVSASTQRLDLGPKARIYARAGIPEYWVLDVEGSELHRFSQPGPDGYATREKPPLGELLTAATIPGLTVATDGLV